MNTRRNEIAVGILFIFATLAAVVSVLLLEPVQDASDHLTGAIDNENRLLISVLFDLIVAVSVVGIGAMFYPFLRSTSQGIALGYVGVRIIEGSIIAASAVTSLLLWSLSQDYAISTVSGDSHFQTLSTMLVEARFWTDVLGTQIVFGVTALILNYLLYRSLIVPRFISIWGIVGAILLLVGSMFNIFDHTIGDPIPTSTFLFSMTIAVNEMVLALWLIIKGLNSPPRITGVQESL